MVFFYTWVNFKVLIYGGVDMNLDIRHDFFYLKKLCFYAKVFINL